ncbi:Protein-L-isoaspartate O-methyltransferase domain-containing protein 2 [Oopsacas minuta]|uniref:Protein-L-isoaspartate O-methyltransferase domain-containing protein 2 n=1 Tax=Oopsacas minuta TaxID=111878 RepID=A0AAV7KI35_9METZ|nr:Protein-L-isoaspartate O-methyltransferase domain-containing protein 2 [Oopsacas minuta]
MGSVVSSADNNEDFVTNLCKTKHIVSPEIEQIFRMVDRLDFMVIEGDESELEAARLEAYEDKPWKNGTLHLSAPCIYTKALEALKIQPKLSFLNIGSGTGYFSTMVGMLLGPRGINRGVEIYTSNVKLARERTHNFMINSPYYDPIQFCPPEFQLGNGLLLDPQHGTYDRVYCGADVPNGYDGVMKCLLNPGGILVMPYNGSLVSITRVSETEWSEETVLSSVSFTHLILPTEECMKDTQAIDFGCNIPSLQRLCRLTILELVQAEHRSHLTQLPLPSHLIAFLTYDGILKAERLKDRPESLIAAGKVPEETDSGDCSDNAGDMISRIVKERDSTRIRHLTRRYLNFSLGGGDGASQDRPNDSDSDQDYTPDTFLQYYQCDRLPNDKNQ